MRADRGKDADQTGAGIGRAADDLNLFHRRTGTARIGRDTAEAQAVGIGMGLRLDHLGDAEGAQLFGGIIDAFDLQPQIGEGMGDRVQRRLGREVIFQPGQGEFHGQAFGNGRHGD